MPDKLEERLRTAHIDLPETDLNPMRDSLAGIRAIRVNPEHFDVLAEAVWNGLEPMRHQALAEITRLKEEVEELRKELSRATGRQRVSIVDQDGNEVGHTHRSMAELLREDAWRDDNGTIWNPPTAWAYFAVCRARDAKQALIDELVDGLEVFIEKGRMMAIERAQALLAKYRARSSGKAGSDAGVGK